MLSGGPGPSNILLDNEPTPANEQPFAQAQPVSAGASTSAGASGTLDVLTALMNETNAAFASVM